MNVITQNQSEFSFLMHCMNAALVEIEALEEADEQIPNNLKSVVQDMGVFCHKIGGVETMRFFLEQHVKARDQRLFEMYWDGIGAWLA